MKEFSKKFLLVFLIGISLFCFSGCKLEKVGVYICYAESYTGQQDKFVACLNQNNYCLLQHESQNLKLADRSLVWGSLVLPAYSSAKVEVDDEDISIRLIKMKDSDLPEVKHFLDCAKGSGLFEIGENSLIIENLFDELKEKGTSVTLKIIFFR